MQTPKKIDPSALNFESEKKELNDSLKKLNTDLLVKKESLIGQFMKVDSRKKFPDQDKLVES